MQPCRLRLVVDTCGDTRLSADKGGDMSKLPEGQIELVEGASLHAARNEIVTPKSVQMFDRVTGSIFTVSMVVMLTVMTLLIGMDVILRVFFSAPIRGTHDLVGLGMLLLFLLGLPHSWRAGHHVRMDMIYGAGPFWFRRAVDVFGAVAAIVFGLMLAYQAMRYVPDLMRRGSSTVTLGVPYWPFAIVIMMSAALFAVSVFIDLMMTIFGRRRSSET